MMLPRGILICAVALAGGAAVGSGCGTSHDATVPTARSSGPDCHALFLTLTDIYKHGPGQFEPAVAGRQLRIAAAESAPVVRGVVQQFRARNRAAPKPVRALEAIVTSYEDTAKRLARVTNLSELSDGELKAFGGLGADAYEDCHRAVESESHSE